MCSVTSFHPLGQSAFVCAQSGCCACLDNLLHTHAGLIHAVVRQQYRGEVPYADLMQEGRIALWQAILHYDPGRGIAFSTYAWQAIRRRIWRSVARAHSGRRSLAPNPQGYLAPTASQDALEQRETLWQQMALQAALQEALGYLPRRLREVLTRAYGLGGQPACSLAALGRDYGVTRERVRQWRNDALVLLRLPALSSALRRLCERNDLPDYRQAQALNRAWLRQRRGGQR